MTVLHRTGEVRYSVAGINAINVTALFDKPY